MNETSSCEFDPAMPTTQTGSRIMRFQEGFRWQTVPVEPYKASADHFCG